MSTMKDFFKKRNNFHWKKSDAIINRIKYHSYPECHRMSNSKFWNISGPKRLKVVCETDFTTSENKKLCYTESSETTES